TDSRASSRSATATASSPTTSRRSSTTEEGKRRRAPRARAGPRSCSVASTSSSAACARCATRTRSCAGRPRARRRAWNDALVLERLPAVEAGVDVVPEGAALLAAAPAEVDEVALAHAVEVEQRRVDALHGRAHLRERRHLLLKLLLELLQL